MEWTDQAIIIGAQRHGESSSVVQMLTETHGRHAGLVRGAFSKRNRAVVERGNRVIATWKARLSDHLGLLALDLQHQTAAGLLAAPLPLAGLAAACAVAEAALPEREPHPALYRGLVALLEVIERHADDETIWLAAYVRWELGLLGELGFGLDLSKCAATGATEDLAFVSPRSGRAVSSAAAAPYKDRMLVLPRFLLERSAADRKGIVDGLELTRYFLQRHVFDAVHKAIPAARDRLADLTADDGATANA